MMMGSLREREKERYELAPVSVTGGERVGCACRKFRIELSVFSLSLVNFGFSSTASVTKGGTRFKRARVSHT